MAKKFSSSNDPILVKEFGEIITVEGQEYYRKSNLLSIVVGLIEGLSLLAIIPTVSALASGDKAWGLPLVGWIIVLAVFAVVGAILVYRQAIMGYMAAMDVIKNVHKRMGDQLARLPLGWFGPKKTGMISRLSSTGLMNAAEGLAHYISPVIRFLTVTIVLLVGTLIWRWQIGVVLLIAIPIAALLSTAARWLKARGDQLTAVTSAEAANRIVEYAACQPALRASGRAGTFDPLDEAIEADGAASRKALWLGVFANVLNGMAIQGIVVGLIFMAARMGEAGTLSPIVTVAFIGLSLRFTWILDHLMSYLLAMENTRVPLQEVKSIIFAEPLPEHSGDAELVAPGSIEFDNVSFAYDDTEVIRNVSFTVKPNTMTALVGPSGSGKTTLFRLIARFWDVNSGAVRVGGVDVRDQPTAQLMAQLSMVYQNVYLYDQTLVENIRVGRQDASDEDVLRVAQLAGVDEIAERLPRGWDSRVGERGGRLSGGERQRVSVARALLKGSPIVLFDEATSALDPENESQIEQSVRALRERATVLVIAHKLDTVQEADQIVVLSEKGEVAQIGTHDELVGEDGLYRQFWQARRNATGWRLAADA
ncbi:MAG: ABC transporter ATP-binding protein [Actinomycetaceae bacterium]|nr:ABC transporter ATP-binding protein [Actinomycetaceae bacterium]